MTKAILFALALTVTACGRLCLTGGDGGLAGLSTAPCPPVYTSEPCQRVEDGSWRCSGRMK